jgi:hypothetical protein
MAGLHHFYEPDPVPGVSDHRPSRHPDLADGAGRGPMDLTAPDANDLPFRNPTFAIPRVVVRLGTRQRPRERTRTNRDVPGARRGHAGQPAPGVRPEPRRVRASGPRGFRRASGQAWRGPVSARETLARVRVWRTVRASVLEGPSCPDRTSRRLPGTDRLPSSSARGAVPSWMRKARGDGDIRT